MANKKKKKKEKGNEAKGKSRQLFDSLFQNESAGHLNFGQAYCVICVIMQTYTHTHKHTMCRLKTAVWQWVGGQVVGSVEDGLSNNL